MSQHEIPLYYLDDKNKRMRPSLNIRVGKDAPYLFDDQKLMILKVNEAPDLFTLKENPSNEMVNIKKLVEQIRFLYMNALFANYLDLDIYIDMFGEWLKIMSHLGPYIKLGFKSIEENIFHIKRNRDTMVEMKFITTSS